MANAGDTFTVELNQAQLEWGTFRFTGSRGLRYGEGYLKIPKPVALNLQLFNGNHTSGYDILGENIFHATSADGLFTGTLRSEGCSNAGDPYAKQFAGDKDLICHCNRRWSMGNYNRGMIPAYSIYCFVDQSL